LPARALLSAQQDRGNDWSAPQLPRETDDPKHWRDRAAHMRTLAAGEDDPNTAQLLTDLAADYEELAERAGRKNKQPSIEQQK
jgi:hypothetical protein